MNRRLYSIIAVLIIVALSTSSVLAGGNIKLSASIRSGSPLHVVGIMTGSTGTTQGVTVTLTGFGNVQSVTCTNPGGRQAPGQNPGRITVTGFQQIDQAVINARANVPVNFSAQQPILPNVCPNGRWAATYNIAWTSAVVDITDNALPNGSNLMLHQEYTCALNSGSSTAYTCTLVSETRYF